LYATKQSQFTICPRYGQVIKALGNKETMEIKESILNSICNSIPLSEFFYLIEARSNYYTGQLFEITSYGTKGHNDGAEIFKKHQDKIRNHLSGIGVILLSKLDGKESQKEIAHYNQELGTSKLFDLILFQEFDIKPSNERARIELETSTKLEKIKNTLVYSCYVNDTNEIVKKAPKASKAQLNKAYNSMTPLGYCARSDNLEAFKCLVDAGAILDKKTIAKTTPLEYAFIHSPTIVEYILSEHKETFLSNVNTKGYNICYQTTDIELLNLVTEYAQDIDCAGSQYPPLHNAADVGNLTALRFFLENGANPHTLNKLKQTALDRALQSNKHDAANLLKEYI